MNKPTSHFPPTTGSTRFVKFLLTSGTSVVVNLLVRFFLSRFVIFEVAVALAYILSTAVAFALARAFVFGPSSGTLRGEMARFAIVNLFGFVQVLIVSTGLLRLAFPILRFSWHPEEVAHFIGLASLAITSFHAHARFSFAKANPALAREARS